MVQLVIWSFHLCREMLVIRCGLKCRKEQQQGRTRIIAILIQGVGNQYSSVCLGKTGLGFTSKVALGKGKCFLWEVSRERQDLNLLAVSL